MRGFLCPNLFQTKFWNTVIVGVPRRYFVTIITVAVATIAALLVASTVLNIMANSWSMDALLRFNRSSTFIVALVYLLANVMIILMPILNKKKATRELFQKGRKKMAHHGNNCIGKLQSASATQKVAPSSPADGIRRFVFTAFPDVHRDKPRPSWLKEG